MKRIIMVLTLACASLFLAQCKKEFVENPSVIPSGETIEVSLNVSEDGSKTGISTTGIVTWNTNDKLYVVGATDGYLGYISAQNPGASAYFTGTITKPAASSQTLHFYYIGNENKVFSLVGDNYTYNISTQTGTLSNIADNFHLMHGQVTGVASGTTNLGTITMTSMMSIAKLKFSKTGTLATELACYGAITTATLNTKTGVLTPGVADVITLNGVTTTKNEMTKDGEIESDEYYMVLLPGSQTLTFANEKLNDVWRSTPKTITVDVNKFYTSNGNVSGPAATITLNNELVGALPGRFSIGTNSKGAKDYKYFSKGNLWHGKKTSTADATWNFEDNQYGYANTWNTDHVSHFYWQPYSRMTNSYTSSYSSTGATTDDIFFTNGTATTPHLDFTVEEVKNTWRTLSKSEWENLLNRGASLRQFSNVTFDDDGTIQKKGLILMPDGWSGTLAATTDYSTWQTLAAAGAVFLPAAGYRYDKNTTINSVDTEGDYWASDCATSSNGGRIKFSMSNLEKDNYDRKGGFSVRLIR